MAVQEQGQEERESMGIERRGHECILHATCLQRLLRYPWKISRASMECRSLELREKVWARKTNVESSTHEIPCTSVPEGGISVKESEKDIEGMVTEEEEDLELGHGSQYLRKAAVNGVDAAERSHEMKPAKMAQGISDLEVTDDFCKNYFAE